MTTGDGGHPLAYWLAETCKAVRKAMHKSQAEVARSAGVERNTVYNFEKSAPWPKAPERLVKGYADVAGQSDSRTLWGWALEAWENHPDVGLPREAPRTGDLERVVRAKLGID